jgi:hypothetical protein
MLDLLYSKVWKKKSSLLNINRRVFLQTVGAAGAGLLLGENAMTQDNPRLSPEQQETVRRFLEKELIGNRFTNCPVQRLNLPMKQAMSEVVKDIDPVLVGKHVIFTKDWLNYIGSGGGKLVTQEQFKKWTETLDKVYECYEDFMGTKPFGNDIIIIGQCDSSHAGINSFCVQRGKNDSRFRWAEVRKGDPTATMMHEMGHTFSYAGSNRVSHWNNETVSWLANNETAAELLVAYALEKGDFKVGYLNNGIDHRRGIAINAMNKFREGKITAFGNHDGSAYDLYVTGLPEKVGWNTVKKAVQSFVANNQTYVPIKSYDRVIKDKQHARAHEFFDRVAFFHDQAREFSKTDPKVLEGIPPAGRNMTGEQVFRNFPDRGKFLDEHFTVATTPLNNAQQATAPSSPATSTIAPTRLRVSTPNPGRVFVNPDL